jgi:hypothetical protein
MERYFNTAGPVRADLHYLLPPLARLNADDLLLLIEQQKYFVLHAPRQTGKTSALLELVQRLNAEGRYRALYVNFEIVQAARHDLAQAAVTLSSEIRLRIGDAFPELLPPGDAREDVHRYGPFGALNGLLHAWCSLDHRPVVLVIDEIDALVGDTLIAVLRQLRAGYTQRPAHFPQSVILCGVRDVRDYRIQTSGQEIITGGSAFNIKAESLRLGNFSQQEIADLYRQHTEATGQPFAPGVAELAWDYTGGQPWLVNALAYEACFNIKPNRDRTRRITLETLAEAKERLIQRRDTHLDQLTDKLREPRVHRVIAPLLTAGDDTPELPPEDVQYVADLGLVRVEQAGRVQIANAIYREVIPRELNWGAQMALVQETAWYLKPDHRLDLPKLIDAFRQFFREHSEAWLERFQYKEAGPQLLLQAFLQRIVNGGGRIDREYGLGRRRTDLYLQWPLDPQQGFHGPVQRAVLELKILHKGLESTLQEGLEQTAAYLDRTGAEEGHLLIFNRDPAVNWDEKQFRRREGWQGRSIEVWGT